MIDLGPLIDIHDCADKCCQHDNCEVAHIRDNKCYAVDCYTKDLCQSISVDNLDPESNAIVYMNKRSGQRQRNKGTRVILQLAIKIKCYFLYVIWVWLGFFFTLYEFDLVFFSFFLREFVYTVFRFMSAFVYKVFQITRPRIIKFVSA